MRWFEGKACYNSWCCRSFLELQKRSTGGGSIRKEEENLGEWLNTSMEE